MGQAKRRGTVEQRLELALHNKKIKEECAKADKSIIKDADIKNKPRAYRNFNSPLLVAAIVDLMCDE